MTRGQSLFEVVIAIAISALIIVSVVSLATNSIRNASYSKNNSLAANYAQETVEWLRGQRDNDVMIFMTNVQENLVWCFSTLSWTNPTTCLNSETISGTPFLRQGNFSTTVVNGKTIVEVDITVSWTDAQGTHEVKSTTNFTDWRQR